MPARALALAVPVAFAGTALAQAPVQERTSLEQRVQRIERMIESNAMLQLLESVKALQREVRELRGEIEVQNHTLEQLERRQRELYADTDRRLQAIETGAVAAAPAAAPAPARPTTPTPAPSAPAPAAGAPAQVAAVATAMAAMPRVRIASPIPKHVRYVSRTCSSLPDQPASANPTRYASKIGSTSASASSPRTASPPSTS